jgi:hypothetical protein
MVWHSLKNNKCWILNPKNGPVRSRGLVCFRELQAYKNRQIKKVNIIFEEGDHAVPGVYDRETFGDYRIVTQVNRRR